MKKLKEIIKEWKEIKNENMDFYQYLDTFKYPNSDSSLIANLTEECEFLTFAETRKALHLLLIK